MIKLPALKVTSISSYAYRVHVIVALVVVLSYTFGLYFYFIQGLDEANFQDLKLETNHFVKRYNQGQTTELANSIHFKGYLGWQSLPDNIKPHITVLKEVVTPREISVKLTDNRLLSFWPKRVIFAVAQPLSDGKTFYLIRDINIKQYSSLNKDAIFKMLLMIWPLALLFFVIMFFSIHFLLKRTLGLSQQLGDWIDNLCLANMSDAMPDFKFDELNRIAKQQQAAMLRMSELLEKEQTFLRHASHELRTPIAVVSSNSELLELMLVEPKAVASVARIKRAALTMQHTTETLLWLSREEPETLSKAEFDIATLLKQLIEDNQYLMQSKAVTVQVSLTSCTLLTNETPCRLLLNNLIRNALQYTTQGEVFISNNGSLITIENRNSQPHSRAHQLPSRADYGYGLGLILVAKIVQKMGWDYSNEATNGGHIATIDFTNKDNNRR